MPDHDVMGEFFDGDGLAWQATQFGHVGWLRKWQPKSRQMSPEEQEMYDASCDLDDWRREQAKGFDDE